MDSLGELQNNEKLMGLCPPKDYNPIHNKIANVLQKSAELFYNSLSTQEELLDRLNYLAGYIESAKEILKLQQK
jgi:hypothetical protein